jgi:hypothetical protein
MVKKYTKILKYNTMSKKTIVGFFEESPGNKSWTRLYSTYCGLLGGVMIIYGLVKPGETLDYYMITTLLGIGAGLKLAQKPMEPATIKANDKIIITNGSE